MSDPADSPDEAARLPPEPKSPEGEEPFSRSRPRRVSLPPEPKPSGGEEPRTGADMLAGVGCLILLAFCFGIYLALALCSAWGPC
jgi:hypothetical protein